MLPEKLKKKLEDRRANHSIRKLEMRSDVTDFSSNDYLGFSGSQRIFDQTHQLLKNRKIHQNGATGSRLLSGNHDLYRETEELLADFHKSEAALIFNSGYDANVGFFSSIPQRGDLIFYDELIHASIRDGIQMSHAKAYKFAHNDIEDLQKRLQNILNNNGNTELVEVYIVTESVFSMDGDTPDIEAFTAFCKENNCHLIIDEAHATGVFGKNGVGLLQDLGLQDQIFARINTFGKALGCHGAVILGSEQLKNYLVNFARSFIYTTGLPPHSLATIQNAYKELEITSEIKALQQNISYFKQKVETTTPLKLFFIESNSAIHCCVIPGNDEVKKVAFQIQQKGFDVKAILSPTVSKGKERLRFCLHSYNTKEEIDGILNLLTTFVSN